MSIIDSQADVSVSLVVNGRPEQFRVQPRVSLADALRECLSLTGVKLGCEQGVCGSCTVLVDGKPMRSCLMLGVQAEGRKIGTIEGLANGTTLHPLQESFVRHHALQCGFCSAGFLASAVALLAEHPRPSREAVREAISGHICRCTGYETIVDAIVDPLVGNWAEGVTHE
jgi:aerobic-type carbon monoxide dehydrogenase small subunit (CoxS/CutS family)